MADIGMPDTLTPEQMAKLGGAAHPDDLPDTLTPDEMERATEKPKSYPPTEDEKLGIDSPLASPRGVVFNRGKGELLQRADRIGTAQQLPANFVPERGLIREDPAMDVATTVAGGGVGKVVGKGVAKLSPIAAKLVEPAVAGAVTSGLQGGNLKQNGIAAGIGAALGVPGAALTAIRGAPAAVAERLPTAVTGGLKSKAAKKVVTGDALSDVLEQHPELKKVLVTSSDPEKKAAAVREMLADLGGKTDPFYQGIDNATAAERYGQAKANVAGLSDKAAEAKRVADELTRAATPTRDLFEEARKIDAPSIREPDLREAARRIDAPITARDAAQEGRERVAEEARAANDSSSAARSAAQGARTEADQMSRAAEKAWNKLDNSPRSPGIDISAIDRNLKKQAVALAREGRSTEALAVGRGRKQLADLYGENGDIPAGTILPARAVRTLANDLGESAFTGDMTTPVAKKTLAQQRIYHAVTNELERAAQKAGLNVDELRALNKQISTLIPVRGVTTEQATRAALAGPEDKLATMIKKPAHVVAGLVSGVPAHLDYALATSPGLQSFANAARSPLPDLANRSLMAGTAAAGARASKPRISDNDYAVAVAQKMKNGLSLQEAIDATETR